MGDRSYITKVCNYPAEGIKIATLTVDPGGANEVATVEVQVFDATLLSAEDDRGLGINMAIEDGLRYLWTSQYQRSTNFPLGVTTYWYYPDSVYIGAQTALVTLAFENHGYLLANDGSAPTGIYEKYIVRRGLNFVMSQLSTRGLSVQPAGNPCVGGLGVVAGDCGGLQAVYPYGYTTPIAMLPFAASGALTRVNSEVGGVTYLMTLGEVLQRMVNTVAWGQRDGTTNVDRGGWIYNWNGGGFDGSTVGWSTLAMLDASAAGANVPAFVPTEFKFGLDNAMNTNGSFDYRADGFPAFQGNILSVEKGGIPLQGMFWTGDSTNAPATITWISDHWNTGPHWSCSDIGCGYTMFNNFKGLKLQGVTTLPGSTRPAGPGTILAGDWYAEYQDYLVATQGTPTSTSGGSWPSMQLVAGIRYNFGNAIAELILSPVVLVLPDPIQFAEIGLQHDSWSDPAGSSAAENLLGVNHTVTARTLSVGGTPVPGVSIDFEITAGPNVGLGVICADVVTDSDGYADCTYTSAVVGTDTIEASVGAIVSNAVTKTWIPPNEPPVCGVITLPPAPVAL